MEGVAGGSGGSDERKTLLEVGEGVGKGDAVVDDELRVGEDKVRLDGSFVECLAIAEGPGRRGVLSKKGHEVSVIRKRIGRLRTADPEKHLFRTPT
mgnify:CR=1 FL=1